VALSGLGADEFFAGYSTFTRATAALRWSKPVFCLPSGARKQIASAMSGLKWMSAQKAADWLSTDGLPAELLSLPSPRDAKDPAAPVAPSRVDEYEPTRICILAF